jgi:hypothetical protein
MAITRATYSNNTVGREYARMRASSLYLALSLSLSLSRARAIVYLLHQPHVPRRTLQAGHRKHDRAAAIPVHVLGAAPHRRVERLRREGDRNAQARVVSHPGLQLVLGGQARGLLQQHGTPLVCKMTVRMLP